jgi:hypothetical protein
MDQKHIIKIAEDYLSTPQTDYAICINGKWGCGKTYLWKNILAPRFTDLSKKILYVSLFGKKTDSDIDASLTMSLLPEKYNKAKYLASTLGGGLLNYNKLKWIKDVIPIKSFINFRNSVICFDDFERSNIDVQPVFGYINSLTEHEGAKVFILVNEEQVKDKKSYENYKEKVVGISIDYQASTNDVIQDIYTQFLSDIKYFHFLKYSVKIVRSIYVSSETGNIRILKNSLFLFQKIFNYLTAHDSILLNKFGETLLHFFLAISFEIKSGSVTEEDIVTLSNLSENILQIQGNRLLMSEEEPSYAEKFISKYYPASDLAHNSFKSIFQYVSKGYLDTELLLSELHKLNYTDEPTEVKERKMFFREMWKLTDEKFIELTNQFYCAVKEGQLDSLSNYWRLFERFVNLARDGLLDCKIEEIISAFKAGVNIAFERGDLRNWSEDAPEKPPFREEIYSSAVSEIFKHYSEICKRINSRAKQKEANELIAALQHDIGAFESILDRKATDSIINLVESKEWLVKIIGLDPEQIIVVKSIFYSRYSSVNIFEFLKEEKVVLLYLNVNLPRYINKDIGLVKMWALKRLHDTINAICTRIPPTE